MTRPAGSEMNFWDWNANSELVGTFIGMKTKVGQWKKTALLFKLDNNAIVHSWSYVALGRGLMGVIFGTKVKIRYLGIKPNDKGYQVKEFEIITLDIAEKVQYPTAPKTE